MALVMLVSRNVFHVVSALLKKPKRTRHCFIYNQTPEDKWLVKRPDFCLKKKKSGKYSSGFISNKGSKYDVSFGSEMGMGVEES